MAWQRRSVAAQRAKRTREDRVFCYVLGVFRKVPIRHIPFVTTLVAKSLLIYVNEEAVPWEMKTSEFDIETSLHMDSSKVINAESGARDVDLATVELLMQALD